MWRYSQTLRPKILHVGRHRSSGAGSKQTCAKDAGEEYAACLHIQLVAPYPFPFSQAQTLNIIARLIGFWVKLGHGVLGLWGFGLQGLKGLRVRGLSSRQD